jgi:5-methylcytosine-specific restriction enzyme subunit McrC
MKIIEITENETISLDDEDILELQLIKNHSPNLPFYIEKNKVVISDYIIGEIQLSKKLIRIKPRHKVLSLNHYFEMLLYIENINSNSIKSISYSNDSAFGVNGLVENFIDVCFQLLSFGLTGVFLPEKKKSFKPKGKLIFDEYKKPLIPLEGVTSLVDDYNINNSANQIVKTALLKINEYARLTKENRYNILKLLNQFSGVQEYKKHFSSIKDNISNFYSSNPFYPITLEYASKIILDFKLGYSNIGGVQWNAFLENSNDTFEKYIRAILEKELEHKTNKWDKPKKFAEISWNKKSGEKAFSPDIIIDFIDGKAKAVFDVKNKYFSPTENNPSELTSVSDIYQLLFYSNQLKSDICGLIYPADGFYEPIPLDITGVDIKFFLLSINMSVDFETRKNAFIDSVRDCLKYT